MVDHTAETGSTIAQYIRRFREAPPTRPEDRSGGSRGAGAGMNREDDAHGDDGDVIMNQKDSSRGKASSAAADFWWVDGSSSARRQRGDSERDNGASARKVHFPGDVVMDHGGSNEYLSAESVDVSTEGEPEASSRGARTSRSRSRSPEEDFTSKLALMKQKALRRQRQEQSFGASENNYAERGARAGDRAEGYNNGYSAPRAASEADGHTEGRGRSALSRLPRPEVNPVTSTDNQEQDPALHIRGIGLVEEEVGGSRHGRGIGRGRIGDEDEAVRGRDEQGIRRQGRSDGSPTPRAYLIESRQRPVESPKQPLERVPAPVLSEGVVGVGLLAGPRGATTSGRAPWGIVNSSLDLGDLDQRTQHLLSKCDSMLANIRSTQKQKEQVEQRQATDRVSKAPPDVATPGATKASKEEPGTPRLDILPSWVASNGKSASPLLDLSGSLESYISLHADASTAEANTRADIESRQPPAETIQSINAPELNITSASAGSIDSSIMAEPANEPPLPLPLPAPSQSQELPASTTERSTVLPSEEPDAKTISVDKSGEVFLFLSTSSLGDARPAVMAAVEEGEEEEEAARVPVSEAGVQTDDGSPRIVEHIPANAATTARETPSRHPIPSEILAYLDSKLGGGDEEEEEEEDADDSRSVRSEDMREFIARAQRYAPDTHSETLGGVLATDDGLRTSVPPPPPPPVQEQLMQSESQGSAGTSGSASRVGLPSPPSALTRLTAESLAPYLEDEVVRLLWRQLCEVRSEMNRRLAGTV